MPQSPYQLALGRMAERRRHARERLVTEAGATVASSASVLPAERAFLTQLNGRTFLTAPASTSLAAEVADHAGSNPYHLYLYGKFVEAEAPNRNGAFWSTADLQFGQPTVAHGPLNWLHEQRRVVGSLVGGQLVRSERAEDRPYIAAAAVMWRHMHPQLAETVEHAAENSSLYYSMECVAKQMACETSADGTRVGCGQSFPYVTAMLKPDEVCPHIRERSSQRRLVDSVFTGGAIIVPPVRPAWADASVELVRTAASEAERTYSEAAGLGEQRWADLMLGLTALAYS